MGRPPARAEGFATRLYLLQIVRLLLWPARRYSRDAVHKGFGEAVAPPYDHELSVRAKLHPRYFILVRPKLWRGCQGLPRGKIPDLKLLRINRHEVLNRLFGSGVSQNQLSIRGKVQPIMHARARVGDLSQQFAGSRVPHFDRV